MEKGSYDIIEPKVRALIENHRTRAITARVTLTAGVTDVVKIFKHLKQDLGFHEVGFRSGDDVAESALCHQ